MHITPYPAHKPLPPCAHSPFCRQVLQAGQYMHRRLKVQQTWCQLEQDGATHWTSPEHIVFCLDPPIIGGQQSSSKMSRSRPSSGRARSKSAQGKARAISAKRGREKGLEHAETSQRQERDTRSLPDERDMAQIALSSNGHNTEEQVGVLPASVPMQASTIEDISSADDLDTDDDGVANGSCAI
eukprot:TRINITY_DN10689_c0_g1_i5.p1 TRINITY_DN10689_c0_g1~~TRINITY_DN10689_c0_g1_i5.p1  ORF type:complete len:184 (+),score=21.90 TRINITY_DN10689_c0_g1_i5:85-636(+)